MIHGFSLMLISQTEQKLEFSVMQILIRKCKQTVFLKTMETIFMLPERPKVLICFKTTSVISTSAS